MLILTMIKITILKQGRLMLLIPWPYLDLTFIPYQEEFAPSERRSQFTGGDAFHVDDLFFASSNILRSSSKSEWNELEGISSSKGKSCGCQKVYYYWCNWINTNTIENYKAHWFSLHTDGVNRYSGLSVTLIPTPALISTEDESLFKINFIIGQM